MCKICNEKNHFDKAGVMILFKGSHARVYLTDGDIPDYEKFKFCPLCGELLAKNKSTEINHKCNIHEC